MSTLTTRLLPALAAATVLVLAGCSGAPSSAPPDDDPTAAVQRGDAPHRSGPGGGATGEIASVTGTVMQVRSSDSQTAVTWTDATEFSATVGGTLADVTVGACVVAVSAGTTTSGSTEDDESAALEATTVEVTEPADDGTCGRGLGGPGVGPDADGSRPAPPTDATERGDGPEPGPGARTFGGAAVGEVTAVDGDTLTVEATGPDGETTSRTVTVTDATTYTRTVPADATAVVVGQCASARGEADDGGKVTATSVTVSAPTDGECTSGMLQRVGGGPGGGRDAAPQEETQEETQDATGGGTDV